MHSVKTVLITGATSGLGGHLTPALLEWSMKKTILEKLDV